MYEVTIKATKVVTYFTTHKAALTFAESVSDSSGFTIRWISN